MICRLTMLCPCFALPWRPTCESYQMATNSAPHTLMRSIVSHHNYSAYRTSYNATQSRWQCVATI